MKKIDSQSTIINVPVSKLYDFISDFNNFERFLPDQVTNWKSSEAECSFSVPNLGNITLRMEKNITTKEVKYIGVSGPAPFELLFESEPLPEDNTQLVLTAFVEAPAFMAMMIGKPVKNFMNILMEQIKTVAEKEAI